MFDQGKQEVARNSYEPINRIIDYFSLIKVKLAHEVYLCMLNYAYN